MSGYVAGVLILVALLLLEAPAAYWLGRKVQRDADAPHLARLRKQSRAIAQTLPHDSPYEAERRAHHRSGGLR